MFDYYIHRTEHAKERGKERFVTNEEIQECVEKTIDKLLKLSFYQSFGILQIKSDKKICIIGFVQKDSYNKATLRVVITTVISKPRDEYLHLKNGTKKIVVA